ncbi:hypothetical protein ABK040_013390 [Willaertia magna]
MREEKDCLLEVYTTYIGALPLTISNCKWLEQTFQLLKIRYKKVDVGKEKGKIDYLKQVSGRKTLPAVLFNGLYIGGYKEFMEWNEEGAIYEALQEVGYEYLPLEISIKSEDEKLKEIEEFKVKYKEDIENLKAKQLEYENNMNRLKEKRRKQLFERNLQLLQDKNQAVVDTTNNVSIQSNSSLDETATIIEEEIPPIPEDNVDEEVLPPLTPIKEMSLPKEFNQQEELREKRKYKILFTNENL